MIYAPAAKAAGAFFLFIGCQVRHSEPTFIADTCGKESCCGRGIRLHFSVRWPTTLLGLPSHLRRQFTGQPLLDSFMGPHHVLANAQGRRKTACAHQFLQCALGDAKAFCDGRFFDELRT